MTRYSHFLLLCILLLFSGCVAVYLGRDLSWDVANYHYYNAYALWHARVGIDYWPVSFIHKYFSPTADYFSYILINHLQPILAVFVMGAVHGLNIYITYLIATCFLKYRGINMPAILLALLGFYSALILPGWGGFEHDNLASVFILGFVYTQISSWRGVMCAENPSRWKSLLGGCCLGIALGIKLTSASFAVGGVLAITLLPTSVKLRIIVLSYLFIGIVLGWCATSGYWLYSLWKAYGNPFFPFYNGIFHSPYFTDTNFNYSQFLPKTVSEWLFYPFYFSLHGTVADTSFTDLRFAILYILFMVFGIQLLYRKIMKITFQRLPLIEYWLYAFSVFSYITWEYFFAIVRYLSPIAMLSPLIIYLLIVNIIKARTMKWVFTGIIFIFIAYTMHTPAIIRSAWYDADYFNVKLPSSIQKIPTGLVLMAYPAYALSNQPKPQSYLIPFFHGWHFIGVPFNDKTPSTLQTNEQKTILNLIRESKFPVYLLSSDVVMPNFYHVARKLGLEPNGNCQRITSSRQLLSGSETWICPVKRVP